MQRSGNLLPLANVLAGVVREAGAFARAASSGPVKTWVKEHNSPVSEVDIAVNHLLK
jgi:myo-inositol-1(or 4)-monophosphatase